MDVDAVCSRLSASNLSDSLRNGLAAVRDAGAEPIAVKALSVDRVSSIGFGTKRGEIVWAESRKSPVTSRSHAAAERLKREFEIPGAGSTANAGSVVGAVSTPSTAGPNAPLP